MYDKSDVGIQVYLPHWGDQPCTLDSVEVTGHQNGPQYIDTLAGLFVRIGEGIAYRQRVDAGQTSAI